MDHTYEILKNFVLIAVNMNEVEALHSMFEQLSCSIVDDGRIHKVAPSLK